MLHRLHLQTTALALAVAVVFCAPGCSEAPAPAGTTDPSESEAETGHTMRLSGQTMGTTWNAVLVWPMQASPRLDQVAYQSALQSELTAIDEAMSTYQEDSDLSRLARAQPGEAVEVSKLTLECLRLSTLLHTDSGGAFDPTVGPLVRLWQFGPGREPGTREIAEPTESEIQSALAKLGPAGVVHGEPEPGEKQSTLSPKHAGLEIDLSAIAKGYGVDRAAAALDNLDVPSYLIEVGGEIRVKGERPGGGPWRLAIEPPFADRPDLAARLEVTDQALATSGSYRNFRVLDDGRRVGHIIDPRTGRPAANPALSASVIGPSCAMADGWATALSILGQGGLALIEGRAEYEARLVMPTSELGGEPTVFTTSGWPKDPSPQAKKPSQAGD